uniref:Uncharacterized protein n=1 Tax=Chromera velia CCMP2878 TaxID=1169474 RepID=A0A0G4I1M2_9ALVE|eukprot:Cvel_10186.t1-p1 / transcript=Cvel_10186.t1 / gene=Cvel_10186 / organism=Chromera_velia_CCMP2878 / gene_product=hypothetical protein / transcript_product=hypothetical protein / location=Cvel_scaffold609:411-1348(+) / protein_length=263 / sequence_SO=supercontig / SO=protein_coding / is_pseudo=false
MPCLDQFQDQLFWDTEAGKWVIEIELSRCEWDGVGCGNVYDICMAFGIIDPSFRFLRKGKTPPMTMMIIRALSEATVGFTLVDYLVKLTLDLHKKPIDIPFGSGPGAVIIRIRLSNTVFLLADYKSHRERRGIVGGTSWWRSPWAIVAAFLYYATVRMTEEEARSPLQHQETLQRLVVDLFPVLKSLLSQKEKEDGFVIVLLWHASLWMRDGCGYAPTEPCSFMKGGESFQSSAAQASGSAAASASVAAAAVAPAGTGPSGGH